MVYRAAYKNINRLKFLSRYIFRIPSENLKSLFSRLIPRYFLWNIVAYHLGNILVYWSRFIPTLFLGNLPALHSDHFITWKLLQTGLFTRLYSQTFSFYGTCLYCWHCQPCTGYQSQCLTPSYKWSSTPTSSWGSHSTGSLTPPDTVSSIPAAYSFTLDALEPDWLSYRLNCACITAHLF